MAEYTPVSTKPVKRFFVEMLTRDIDVEDAILDLLDNCVDGILRSLGENDSSSKTPYKGFYANIEVNGDRFQIEDNCGGIPWSEHDKAFRMGRPNPPTTEEGKEIPLSVGVYGIGMKRAIFKMGTDALIWTQNNDDGYEIQISPEWIVAEELWDLDVQSANDRMIEDGTCIIIEGLYENIVERFISEIFETSLILKIANHYSVILQKGFIVKVNGKTVTPNPVQFRFAEEKSEDGTEIRPYVFRSEYNGVRIYLAVGLREPIPGAELILSEQDESTRFRSEYAGWTVICNDRVVLYCNRDELTGWGTAGVPKYHTQFIAISGVLEFQGPPEKLPTTTTKRGLEFSSSIYQQTLDRMREGTVIFTNFTNKWKTREEVAKKLVSPTPALSYSTIKEKSESLSYTQSRRGLEGEIYKPKLPLPPRDETDVRISYSREKKFVMELAEKLLENVSDLNENEIRKQVGEKSFDFSYVKLVNEIKEDK